MSVDRPRRGDQALPADHRGAGAHDHVHPVQGVGIPGPPDRCDPPVPHPDGRLPHPEQGIQDQDVGHDKVAGAGQVHRGQMHAVPSGLAEPQEELLAALLGVGLDPDHQAGVRQHHLVADGRAVHRRVVVRGHPVLARSHSAPPSVCPEPR